MANSHSTLYTHAHHYLKGGSHVYLRSNATNVKPYYTVGKLSLLTYSLLTYSITDISISQSALEMMDVSRHELQRKEQTACI